LARLSWLSGSGRYSADEDATLVEVNPMILSTDGRVLALDGKVTLDDNGRVPPG